MKSTPQLGFVHGVRTISRAITVLREQPQILRLLLIPLVLTAVLDAAAFFTSYSWLHEQLVSYLPAEGLLGALRGLLSILAGLLVLFGLAWTFDLVYLLLCELVIDRVSEAVEQRLTGHHPDDASARDRLGGLARSLGQSVILLGVGLGALLLGVIPIVGPILAALLSIAALGYGFLSIPAGRRAATLTDRLDLARTHLSSVMGLGVPVFVASLIPFGNLLLLPVFIVAGTLLFLDIEARRRADAQTTPHT
ncbi:MAG: EI24 domain-containing protein [Polyangia bacterium]|mgnify:FL=1|jgi:CysZ protein